MNVSRGHKLIAAAIVLVGLLVAVAVWPETCGSWRERERQSFIDTLGGSSSRAEHAAVWADKPKGCTP